MSGLISQALGGVKYIFLTHRDDVADHDSWAAEFGAERIIHASECNSQQGTECVCSPTYLLVQQTKAQ